MKIKILFAILISGIVFTACPCPDDYYYYWWVDFNIDLLDNSGLNPVATDADTINKKAFGMKITIPDSVPYDDVHVDSFGNCVPIPARRYSLLSIRILTINDYSVGFPAGSDISALFKAGPVSDNRSDYLSLEQIVQSINDNHAGAVPQGCRFNLFLLDTNADSSEQVFEVRLLLSDSSSIVKQSRPVKLI